MVRCSSALLLLAAAASLTGYLSIAPWLEPLPRLLLPAALVWLLARRGRGGAIPARPALFLALGLLVFFIAAMPRQGIVTPSIGLLVSLLALRLVSEKSGRHYLQICALCIFLLAASSIHTLSPLFMVYLLLLMLLVTMMLLLLSYSHYGENRILERPLLKRIGQAAVMMNAAAAPLVVVLFMVLPRTQVPLWRFGAPVETARIGFSESVRPGSAASMTAERVPVFRAAMPEVSAERLYWRGIVLNRIEGNVWIRSRPPASIPQQSGGAGGMQQSLQLEPGSGTFLFALDVPRSVMKVRATLHGDGVIQAPAPLTRRFTYGVLSVDGSAVVEDSPQFYLQLPDRLSPRLRQLAERLRVEAPVPLDRLQLLEEQYRRLNLRYDVKGLPTTGDPIDTFLFEGKRGNCEFFAASYALLLRAAGIPARLVGGYFGGTYNEVGGYYLVTQDMAHTWVEYYLEGRGWLRVDPTLWGEGFERVADVRSSGSKAALLVYADTLAYIWNGKVIPYDFESQYEGYRQSADLMGGLFRSLRTVRLERVVTAVVSVLAIVILCRFAGRRLFRRQRLMRLLQQFEQRLRKYDPGLPPLSRAGVIGLADASGLESARQFASLYAGIIYRDGTLTDRELKELGQLLERV